MGEISEALRLARQERVDPRGESASATTLRGNGSRRPPVQIPRTRQGAWAARAVAVEGAELSAESFRRLALRVRNELEQRNASSLCVTSAMPGEGKTFTACNLALALASVAVDHRVVLVDMDLRRPGIGRGLGVSCSVGFERVLRAEADLESVVIQTDMPSLDLLLVARPVPDPHRWLASPRLQQSLDELTQQYGVVVCDTPAALPCPEIGLITPHIGACLMVARAGRTPRSALSEMRDLLPRNKVIGTFLNWARRPLHERKYGYEQYASGSIEAREERG